MAGVNEVIIIGRLGNDPEVRTLNNSEKVATISVATSESWTDKQSGEKRENTQWHRIVFYRKLADIVAQYLTKGAQVYVKGRLNYRKWQDQNGIERHITEIVAIDLQMLGSKGDNAQAKPQPKAQPKPKSAPKPILATDETDPFADDIPF
ncbi:single-stranded DNA-binding protein [Pasteurellaceae bacterium 20609_3]|uniref:single-stranded DNA-binding protein n=1 Tax=Spirabiliibacterium mucosae TaxID=28156 RepID=UPI001AAD9D52|nr:single-stranded DNA-binding protein [Spirabiliibacterium mucosae]MBE2898119.1 single-stranded DNA-binding protein [Spirabiliibacterium mucosae]